MRLAVVLLAALFLSGFASMAQAGCSLEPGDEMWLVSTRCLPSCAYYDGSFAPNYVVHRYEEGRWQAATLADYYATQSPDAITVAHMHGNRYEEADAIERGWQAYRIVRREETSWSRVRMVIWSWPSEKIPGPLDDFRTKSERTEMEAYYFGYFVAHHNADSQLSLIGHSFGARIICGALHIVAGGRLPTGYLKTRPAGVPPIRAVVMAAAMHNYWLAKGHRYGRALEVVQSMRILYNPCDRFLKYYSLVVKREKPDAMGITGPIGNLGDARQRIELYNVAPYVGTAHFEREYFASGTICKLIREHAMWREAVPGAQEVAAK